MLGERGEQVVVLEVQRDQPNRQRQLAEHPADRLEFAGDVDRQVDLEHRDAHPPGQQVGPGVEPRTQDDDGVDVVERLLELVGDETLAAGQIRPQPGTGELRARIIR